MTTRWSGCSAALTSSLDGRVVPAAVIGVRRVHRPRILRDVFQSLRLARCTNGVQAKTRRACALMFVALFCCFFAFLSGSSLAVDSFKL